MALGSSVVNKSSKKLAPKAPAQRRRPADGSSQPVTAEAAKPAPDARHDAAPEPSPSSVVKDVTLSALLQSDPTGPVPRAQSHSDEIYADRPNKRRRLDTNESPAAVGSNGPGEPQVPGRHSVPPAAPSQNTISATDEARHIAEASSSDNAITTSTVRANTDGYLPTPESTQVEQAARAPSFPPVEQASSTRSTYEPHQDHVPQAPPESDTRTPQLSTTTTNTTTINQTTTHAPATPRSAKSKLVVQLPVLQAPTSKATVTELAKQKARADRARGHSSPERDRVPNIDQGDELPPMEFAAAVLRPTGSPTLEDAEALLALRNAHTNGFINVGQTDNQGSDADAGIAATQEKAAASKQPRIPRQKKVSATTETQAGEGTTSLATPAKKPRAPRKKKAALSAERVMANGDDPNANITNVEMPVESTEGSGQQSAPAKVKKPRKSRRKPETSEDDPQAAGIVSKTRKPRKPRAGTATSQADGATTQTSGEPPIDPALLQGENGGGEHPVETAQDKNNQDEAEDGTPAPGRRGRRPRSPTPSDAEDVEIDPTAVSMMDLTVDMRQGRISNREKEMRKINWVEVAIRRREAEAEAKAKAIAGEGPGAEDEDDRQREAEEDARRRNADGPSRGPQLKLVNGVMVLDTDSLVMDNRMRLDDNANAVEEENDLTKKITSHSWLYDNRRAPEERFASTMKSDPWSSEQTDAFYEALRMFGTDFFIISKMFPGKTRRHIKLKFVREERSDPERVKSALIGEVKEMDMSVYCEATGLDEDHFKNPEELEEELRQAEEVQKEEIEQAKADALKKAVDKQSAAKEKSTKAKRGKKKQNTDVGDPEIIIG
jgi:transcription factor TFIIIB component B''